MLKERIDFIRDYIEKQQHFSAKCKAETERFQPKIDGRSFSKRSQRRDLRNLPTLTIDGASAKDLDDAISLTLDEAGLRHLYVHIADVSHYVQAGTSLDEEAYARGNSFYLGEIVLPMLPKILANNLCSLQAGTNKLTLTAELVYDQEATLVRTDFYESVIKSDLRATYEDIYAYFQKGELDDPLTYELLTEADLANMPAAYRKLAKEICLAKQLAAQLRAKRIKHGSIMFEVPELEFTFNAEHEPIKAGLHVITWTNQLIEEFMIAANEAVAAYAKANNIDIVYRTHGQPEAEKFANFLQLAKALGAIIPRSFYRGVKAIKPVDINHFLTRNQTNAAFSTLETMLLRSQAKACYLPQAKGHFGLALADYCHFTSPIRRYSDLLTHRALKNYWHRKSNKHLAKNLSKQCEHISEQERMALMMERDVDDILSAKYMQQFIGERYTATVSGIVAHGVFLDLPNAIEGFLPFRDLADHFIFMPEKMLALGLRTRKTLHLGDKIEVELARVDLETYLIDFVALDPYLGVKKSSSRVKKSSAKAKKSHKAKGKAVKVIQAKPHAKKHKVIRKQRKKAGRINDRHKQ